MGEPEDGSAGCCRSLAALELSARDVELLQGLVRYRSRADMAAALGYSERHLRRLLDSLLARMRAPTTHAAVALAVAAGLIDGRRSRHR